MPSGKREDVVFHVQRVEGLFQSRSQVQGLSIAFRDTFGGKYPCGGLGGGCAMGYLRWSVRSSLHPGVSLSHSP